MVVDPRRTETAALADRAPLHPARGRRALPRSRLLHVLFAEDRVAPGPPRGVHRRPRRGGRRGRAVPARARGRPRSASTPATIRSLARDFARAPSRRCLRPRRASARRSSAALAAWLVNVLNVRDRQPRPAGRRDVHAAGGRRGRRSRRRIGQRGHFDKGRSRVRGLPEFGGEWPVAALAEEIETPGRGPDPRRSSRSAGNPVLSTPNGARLDRALAGLDFMVSIDFYLNETTRHAHLILPPDRSRSSATTTTSSSTLLAVRNTAKYSPAALRPGRRRAPRLADPARARRARLERRGGRVRSRRGARASLLGRSGPRACSTCCCASARTAPGFMPFGGGLTLGRLDAQPHGVDLGPLEPCLPGRLCTRTRRIALAPAPLRRRPARGSRRGSRRRRRGGARAHRPARAAQQQLVDAQQRAPGEGPRALHAADAPGGRGARAGCADGQRVRVALAGGRGRGAAGADATR